MKKVNLTKNHFFCRLFRENKKIIAIMHALETDGVKPTTAIKSIKKVMLKSFILRFEAFNFFKIVVIPIMTKPHMCARYC